MTAAKRHVWAKSDRERITGYVELWRGLLHMNGWHVEVQFAGPCSDENCVAESVGNHPYRSGYRVKVHPILLECAPAEQCRKILHEMVHIITRPLRAAVHDLVNEKLVLWRDFADREEHAVDWVANIVYALANEVRANPPKKKRKR